MQGQIVFSPNGQVVVAIENDGSADYGTAAASSSPPGPCPP